MAVSVRKTSKYADTSAQGDLLYQAMVRGLKAHDTIVVDFSGIHNATSSFVNSSFVRLLELYSFHDIQTRVGITGVNRQIATMIKSRMQFEAAAA